jgi:hypothetical protein
MLLVPASPVAPVAALGTLSAQVVASRPLCRTRLPRTAHSWPAPAGSSFAHGSSVLSAGRGLVLEPPAGLGMPARKRRTSSLAAWVASVM